MGTELSIDRFASYPELKSSAEFSFAVLEEVDEEDVGGELECSFASFRSRFEANFELPDNNLDTEVGWVVISQVRFIGFVYLLQ